jgi:hypothetical protein
LLARTAIDRQRPAIGAFCGGPARSVADDAPHTYTLSKKQKKGFGRIGRLVMRAALDNPKIELVGINDPFMCVFFVVSCML